MRKTVVGFAGSYGKADSVLVELDAERKRILRDLRSVEVRESDPEGKQRQVLNERRLVRSKLDAINVAIRAAGGSVKPGG